MSPAPPPSLALSPGPIPPSSRSQWQTSKTLGHTLCPAQPELALASVAKASPPTSGKVQVDVGDKQVFLVRWDSVPAYLVPLYSRTYTIFQSLQQIVGASVNGWGSRGLPDPDQISCLARICSLYDDALRQHLLTPPSSFDDDEEAAPAAASSSTSAIPPSALGPWALARSTLQLVGLLYAPADGRGEGVVGEELLDWLNQADCGPTAEEADELLSGQHAAEPWRAEGFWGYVARACLRGFIPGASALVGTLGAHPSRAVSELAPRLAGHLERYPRSVHEPTERAFLASHAQWRAGLRLLSRPLQTAGWARASTDGGEISREEADEVEEALDALLGLLAGEEDKVLDECVDWREALGAWGFWVRPGLKRDDLPETIGRILERLPPSTDDDMVEGEEEVERQARVEEKQADRVQLALVKGDAVGAAAAAVDSLPWLAAHMIDLLELLGLVPPSSPLGTGSLGLRDHYVLAYAGHLGADPGLWQIAAEYAGAVQGPIGQATVGALLSAVSLDREPENEAAEESLEQEEEEPKLDEAKVEEVLRLLATHNLEDRARSLARTAAGRLASERRFGLSVAFAVRANDTARLDDVAERILACYVRKGPQEFISHVESIPTSLLDPLSPLSAGSPALAFLPRYQAFLAAYASGDRAAAAGVLSRAVGEGLAPRSFWAVLMLDLVPLLDDPDMLIPTETAFVLLGQLEDLLTHSVDEPKACLDHLANLRTKSTSDGADPAIANGAKEDESAKWRDVRKSLDVVRLALARYLARDLTMS